MNAAPSFMILGRGKNPTTVRWSMQDRILFMALQILEAEVCPDCGVPYWWAYSAHPAIEYAIEFSKCLACADLEVRTKDIELGPGEHKHVRAVDDAGRLDGLPSRVEALGKLETPLYNVPDE